MATELDLQPRRASAPKVAPLRAGKPMGREGSSNDLALAMQAAALAADSDGPDLDEVTDELVAARRAATPKLDIEVLDVVRPIGMGGQGGVWLGVDPVSGIRMAIKQIRKGRLTMLPKKAMTRALTERECLHDVGHHPFITNCFATFQNESSLFFCLELAPGGDLFGLLDTQPNGLPEHQARFYCSCIALALRHVHAHGWVYRDVKCAARRRAALSPHATRPAAPCCSPPVGACDRWTRLPTLGGVVCAVVRAQARERAHRRRRLRQDLRLRLRQEGGGVAHIHQVRHGRVRAARGGERSRPHLRGRLVGARHPAARDAHGPTAL